jgi:DNA-binding MarR family transcriptional regulator
LVCERAKRIYLTQKGHHAAQASRLAVLEVARRISETLGKNKYEELRRNLTAISAIQHL